MAFFRRVKKRLQGDDPQQLKRELQWLQTQVGRYKGKILAVGLLSLTGTIMGLISSVASKYLIDAVTGYGADMLWRAVAIMAVMLLGSLVLQGVSSRVGASVHVDVKNLRNVHRQFQRWVIFPSFQVDNGLPPDADQLGQV